MTLLLTTTGAILRKDYMIPKPLYKSSLVTTGLIVLFFLTATSAAAACPTQFKRSVADPLQMLVLGDSMERALPAPQQSRNKINHKNAVPVEGRSICTWPGRGPHKGAWHACEITYKWLKWLI